MSDAIPSTDDRSRINVLLCFLVAVLEGYDLQVIGVAAPHLAKALALAPQQLGLAFSASLIGLAIGAPIGGRIADRFGRKPALLASVAVFGICTLLTEFATSFTSLLVLRFLTGLGLGGSMPNIVAIVSESGRGRITMRVAGMACGLSVGGVCVSLLARLLGGTWHTLFLVGGLAPLVLLPVLWFALRETRPGAAPARDAAAPTGAAREIFGPGHLLMSLSLWIVFALTLLQLSVLLNWLPSLLIAKGFPPAQAFMASVSLNIGGIVGSLLIGWLCDRYGARGPMVAVYVLMAATLFALSSVATPQLLLLLSFLIGLLVLGAQFVLYGFSPQLYPAHVRGAGVGAAVGVGRIGAIVGPLIAGQMMQASVTGTTIVLSMTPFVVVAAMAMVVLSVTSGDRLRPAARGSNLTEKATRAENVHG